MTNEYHPWGCGEAINLGSGVYVCRMGVMLCALHQKEKCYKQRSDDAVQVLKEILEGDNDERTGSETGCD